jgi:two-component system chemotaxis response regulator CheY
MKILIVDDSKTILQTLRFSLEKLYYNDIEEAINGEEAIKILKKEKIDMVITDWNMPKVSGLDLLQLIKSEDEWKNIPVLMLTTEAEKEQIIKALKSGASNYIIKPFKIEQLEKKIKDVLEKS